jgi:hypothetical protein
MWLVSDLTPADIDDPQPGAVFAGRIGLDRAQVAEGLPSPAPCAPQGSWHGPAGR